MKTIGLLGGTTYHSTIDYYRMINQLVNERTGGHHFARLILYSFDFHDIFTNVNQGRYDIVYDAAVRVEQAGAEGLLLCANTLHMMADETQERIGIPLINIIDATIAELKKAAYGKVGLLGTRFTMERKFYTERVEQQGIEILVPPENDREFIQSLIYDELSFGLLNPSSKERMLGIIGELGARGAEAIILGCTELPLLLKPGDTTLPLLDSTEIHVKAAVDFMLE